LLVEWKDLLGTATAIILVKDSRAPVDYFSN
jgi:hypothetical protein